VEKYLEHELKKGDPQLDKDPGTLFPAGIFVIDHRLPGHNSGHIYERESKI
jgi:hypothetical protein